MKKILEPPRFLGKKAGPRRPAAVAVCAESGVRVLRLRFTVLSGAMLLGVLLAHCCMPLLFRALPSDLARTEVLLQSLRSRNPSPEICVLGDSRAMNGIDARELGRLLPDHPEVWNLSTTGQEVFEGFLYYQEFPPSVTTVVHCVSAGALEGPVDLSPSRYQAFSMYGYRPQPMTVEAARQFGAPETAVLLDASSWTTRFGSRWIARAWFDRKCRSLLRTDLALHRATHDLYYPSPYTKKVALNVVRTQIRELEERRKSTEFVPDGGMCDFLRHVDEWCKQRKIRFVLMVVPERPEYRAGLGGKYAQQLDDYSHDLESRLDIATVNCFSVLDSGQFIDHVHPDRAGAAALAEELSGKLAGHRKGEGEPRTARADRLLGVQQQ